jgi:hypothetical protein
MFKKHSRSNRRVSAVCAAAAVATGLLLLAGPSATAATIGESNRAVAATHVSADADPAGVQPAFVGNVYTGQIGSANVHSPQFSGPTPTPANPNPPTQYVHVTAGSAGATVAKSVSFGGTLTRRAGAACRTYRDGDARSEAAMGALPGARPGDPLVGSSDQPVGVE